jgi:hypothetical protein
MLSSVSASVDTGNGMQYYNDSTVFNKVFDSNSIVGFEDSMMIFKVDNRTYYVPTQGLKKIHNLRKI